VSLAEIVENAAAHRNCQLVSVPTNPRVATLRRRGRRLPRSAGQAVKGRRNSEENT